MLVKITQPGWASYTGPLFGVHFENAVSQGPVRRDQALQLGAMVSVVEVDEHGNELGPVSPAHELVVTRDVSAEIVERMKTDAQAAGNDGQTASNEPDAIQGDDGADMIETEAEGPKVYTEAELQDIADAKGIAGLRDIGEPLGVKNTSIRGLIREILAAQNGQ